MRQRKTKSRKDSSPMTTFSAPTMAPLTSLIGMAISHYQRPTTSWLSVPSQGLSCIEPYRPARMLSVVRRGRFADRSTHWLAILIHDHQGGKVSLLFFPDAFEI